jgi:DNA polymerase III delta prime subunit
VFENLLGQDEIRERLRSEAVSGTVPPALLLSGPPASGKATAALELARVLSCARGANWNCPCPSCARHRVLAHSDMLLFGPRSFPEEIPAALELLGRAPGKAAAFFFVRAARKLLRRFDAALYEGEESRLAKAAPLVREAEEQLEAVAPDKAGQGSLADGAADAAAKAAAACSRLEALVPEAPPVFMVRNAELWARLAPLGPRKVAIVENADRMLESARNAFLKILEEPPDSVRFVLATPRVGAVMATIRSRARSYVFRQRDPAGTALVLGRVFRSSEPAPSVESFLAARRAFPPTAAREHAEAFIGAALASRADSAALSPPLAELARFAAAGRKDGPAALAALLEATVDFGQRDDRFSSSFRSFLEALSARLADVLRDPGLDAAGLALVRRFAELSREARAEHESFNRSPSLLAESMLYSIREAM